MYILRWYNKIVLNHLYVIKHVYRRFVSLKREWLFFAKDNILAEYKTNDGSLWNFFCDVQKGPIKTFIPGKKSQS